MRRRGSPRPISRSPSPILITQLDGDQYASDGSPIVSAIASLTAVSGTSCRALLLGLGRDRYQTIVNLGLATLQQAILAIAELLDGPALDRLDEDRARPALDAKALEIVTVKSRSPDCVCPSWSPLPFSESMQDCTNADIAEPAANTTVILPGLNTGRAPFSAPVDAEMRLTSRRVWVLVIDFVGTVGWVLPPLSFAFDLTKRYLLAGDQLL